LLKRVKRKVTLTGQNVAQRYTVGCWVRNRLHYIIAVIRQARAASSLNEANAQEVNAMPNLRPGTIVPTPKEDAEITAAAMDDPDARPFSDNEWELVKPIRSGDVPVDSGSLEPRRSR
jgi:hypothetical protein